MVKKQMIPKASIEPLMGACEMYSKETGVSAQKYFEYYLGLMDKYSDYFFSEQWPTDYEYEKATSFTDEDLDFLLEDDKSHDRFMTICLKKNIYLNGFMGYFGIFWTKQAFHDKYIRPSYEPIKEAFQRVWGTKDAKFVLEQLKAQFTEEEYKISLIHDSILDLHKHEYLDKPTCKLIDELMVLLHTQEKLDPCGEIYCYWNNINYSKESRYGVKNKA